MRRQLILGALALALTAACGEPPDNGSGAATTLRGDRPAEATLHQPVRDGNFEFTVTNVSCGLPAIGSSPVLRRARGQFCLISMRIRNIGDEPRPFDASLQKVVSAAGQEYPADVGASRYAVPSSAGETPRTEINPGSTLNADVAFDVPKGPAPVRAELHDSPSSRGVTVRL